MGFRFVLFLCVLAVPLFAVTVADRMPGAIAVESASGKTAKATFASGCFWCMEAPFEGLDGVISVTVGYTGGTKADPTYEEVSAGTTGHAESVEVVYDPVKLAYGKLLEIFWRNVDPTVADRQFCDVGHQYRTAIFTHDDAQRAEPEASKAAVAKRVKTAVRTEIVAAGRFWPAEEYHQHYARKNPLRYHSYRSACGRDARLKDIWGRE